MAGAGESAVAGLNEPWFAGWTSWVSPHRPAHVLADSRLSPSSSPEPPVTGSLTVCP